MRLRQFINYFLSIGVMAILISALPLTHAQEKLSIVYQGVNSNDLYVAWFSNDTWTGNEKIQVDGQVLQSNITPGVAALNKKLYIVYNKGVYSSNLYAAWFDDDTWMGHEKIWAAGQVLQSNATPGMAALNNKLYIVYQNGMSNFLYYALFDGTNWTGGTPITVGQNNLQSASSPSVAVFKDSLYIIYTKESTNNIHVAHLAGDQWQGDTAIQVPTGNTLRSPFSPGVAEFKGNLYIVYKRVNNNNFYTAQYDGKHWKDNTQIPQINGSNPQSSYSPGVAVFNNKLYLVYRGAHNNDIYTAWFDGKTWEGNTAIKNQPGWINPESNFSPGVAAYGNPTTTTNVQHLEIKIKLGRAVFDY